MCADMQQLPDGDLEVLELVGSGGFGSVYKARSKKLGMEIAVKILYRHSCFSAEFANLMKEKDMMMKANSTYVLRILAIYEKQDKEHMEYGLVMEYMPHGSLHSLLIKSNEKKVLIPWALKFQILHQVALAMNFLHGLDPAIIHRDLKPQNVLLRKDLDVQLTDFGLARNETSASVDVAGTVSYMPPESYTYSKYKPSKAFDVYSFGILIWATLSSQEPYHGTSRDMIMNQAPHGTRPDMKYVNCWKTVKMVPEAIEVMGQCWNGDPRLRPCFAECMERLEKIKKAYDAEIEDAVLEVLNNLRVYSSSSKTNQFEDTPDNYTKTSDYDLDTNKIENFLKRLNLDTASVEKNITDVDESNLYEDIVIQDAKEFLRKNFSKIIQEKPAWNCILDELFTQQIFTEEEVDSVKSCSMIQDQIRETLTMIMKQGPRNCRMLVELMKHCYPSFIRNLAS